MATTAVTWGHVRAIEAFLAPLAAPGQTVERREADLRGERALAG
jgi:hypothetical protein